jgi:hypothetical protein
VTFATNILGSDRITEPLARLVVTNFENRADLGTNENNHAA